MSQSDNPSVSYVCFSSSHTSRRVRSYSLTPPDLISLRVRFLPVGITHCFCCGSLLCRLPVNWIFFFPPEDKVTAWKWWSERRSEQAFPCFVPSLYMYISSVLCCIAWWKRWWGLMESLHFTWKRNADCLCSLSRPERFKRFLRKHILGFFFFVNSFRNALVIHFFPPISRFKN